MKKQKNPEAEQLPLLPAESVVPPEKQHMFTVACAHSNNGRTLWGQQHSYSYRHRHRSDKIWHNKFSKPPLLQLLFDTRNLRGTPPEKLNHVMGSRVASSIIKTQLWFTQLPGIVAVASRPLVPVSCSDLHACFRDHGIGFMSGNRTRHAWTYKELSKRCFFLERVTSNCRDCQTFDNCALTLIREDPAYGFLPTDYACGGPGTWLDDCDEPEGLFYLLQNHSQWGDWRFIPPMRATRDHFSARVPDVDQIDFAACEDMKRDRSERSRSASKTRAAHTNAKKNCALYRGCFYAPHYMPHWCRRCEQGPVSPEWIAERIRGVASSLSAEQKERLSFIATNSGETTKLLGPRLSLGKFDSETNHVTFLARRYKDRQKLAFEDAYQILTTPYREDGKYVYPNVRRGAPLTEEQLALYQEVSGHTYLDYFRTRGWGFSDEIAFIKAGWSRGIVVITRMGHQFEISCFADLLAYYYIGTIMRGPAGTD